MNEQLRLILFVIGKENTYLCTVKTNKRKMIKLSLPHLAGKEQEYVGKAIESTWIVPLGPYVDEFECRLDNYLGQGHTVALSAGTAAIHLGLVMAGVKPGDEVICQSMTFSASCNPIVYLGAKPVFIDSETETWNLDPVILEQAITDRKRITGKYPAAIVPVHLYGMPARMDEVMEIARRYGIPVVEDAAEALGSEYRERKCGTIGDSGALSFNGNKIITTSGGGALICATENEAARVRFLATQARENRPYYYHETIGYNYRLSNISAAIGCAQIEELAARVARRREIHGLYLRGLEDAAGVTVHDNPGDDFNSNFWLTTVILDKKSARMTPDEVRLRLLEEGIETRLLWRPMNMQPVYEKCPYYYNDSFKSLGYSGVGEWLFNQGLCLPSGSSLTNEEVETVIAKLKKVMR